jgi:hypothetical protein
VELRSNWLHAAQSRASTRQIIVPLLIFAVLPNLVSWLLAVHHKMTHDPKIAEEYVRVIIQGVITSLVLDAITGAADAMKAMARRLYFTSIENCTPAASSAQRAALAADRAASSLADRAAVLEVIFCRASRSTTRVPERGTRVPFTFQRAALCGGAACSVLCGVGYLVYVVRLRRSLVPAMQPVVVAGHNPVQAPVAAAAADTDVTNPAVSHREDEKVNQIPLVNRNPLAFRVLIGGQRDKEDNETWGNTGCTTRGDNAQPLDEKPVVNAASSNTVSL